MATRKKPTLQARITIRLTDDEQSKLLTEAAGQSISAYARQCLFGGSAKRSKLRMPHVNEVVLAQVLARLGQSRLSSNLNQLAKAVHLGVLPVTPETEAEIVEACAAVVGMRRDLIVALGLNAD